MKNTFFIVLLMCSLLTSSLAFAQEEKEASTWKEKAAKAAETSWIFVKFWGEKVAKTSVTVSKEVAKLADEAAKDFKTEWDNYQAEQKAQAEKIAQDSAGTIPQDTASGEKSSEQAAVVETPIEKSDVPEIVETSATPAEAQATNQDSTLTSGIIEVNPPVDPAVEQAKRDAQLKQEHQDLLLSMTKNCMDATDFPAMESCLKEANQFGQDNNVALVDQALFKQLDSKKQKLNEIYQIEQEKKAKQLALENTWNLLSVKKTKPEMEGMPGPLYAGLIPSLYPPVDLVSLKIDNQDIIQSIIIKNLGSPHINPQGNGNPYSDTNPSRRYEITMDGHARSSLYIGVVDDVTIAGVMSADLMNTEIHILPRKYLFNFVKEGDSFKLTLPNEEEVVFDSKTNEIISGVLEEVPMDRNPNRQARYNPRFKYSGKGIAFFPDQRGAHPRSTLPWGKNDHIKKSKTVGVLFVYPSKYEKSCTIPQVKLWKFDEKYDSLSLPEKFLYHNEEDLYKIIEKECKWDLGELREWFKAE